MRASSCQSVGNAPGGSGGGASDWLAKPQGKTLAALAVLLIALIVVVAAARSSMGGRRRRPPATVLGNNTPSVTDTPRNDTKP